jgi:hypothetical protein
MHSVHNNLFCSVISVAPEVLINRKYQAQDHLFLLTVWNIFEGTYYVEWATLRKESPCACSEIPCMALYAANRIWKLSKEESSVYDTIRWSRKLKDILDIV